MENAVFVNDAVSGLKSRYIGLSSMSLSLEPGPLFRRLAARAGGTGFLAPLHMMQAAETGEPLPASAPPGAPTIPPPQPEANGGIVMAQRASMAPAVSAVPQSTSGLPVSASLVPAAPPPRPQMPVVARAPAPVMAMSTPQPGYPSPPQRPHQPPGMARPMYMPASQPIGMRPMPIAHMPPQHIAMSPMAMGAMPGQMQVQMPMGAPARA